MKIGFHGAARQVTGSKHLITLKNGKQILLDCGMFQGRGRDTFPMNNNFGFDPSEITYLLLSHAHIDHSGLIPLLVKRGFKGKIYCTSATADLCELMLKDSARIQESDIAYINKKRRARGKSALSPLYTSADAENCLKLMNPVPYNTTITIDDEVQVNFTDTGHILGSACVNVRIKEGYQYYRIAFTGDIGRYSNRILRAPQTFPQADYLICESTYGNKLHSKPPQVKEKLLNVVQETCLLRGGKLIIPAFSVGRTQEIVSILNDLEFEGKIPALPVFVDSPMAVNATFIMKDHPECFNKRMIEFMAKDPDPFGFSSLKYVRKVEDSKAINHHKGPCIIISASGMIEGGRIKHHLIQNIEDSKNTILMVGWCSRSSIGGQLINKAEEINIFGQRFKVNAQVAKLNPLSAHGDYEEMMRFLSCQDKQIAKKIFLVHGEYDVMEDFEDKLKFEGFNNVVIPDYHEEIRIGN